MLIQHIDNPSHSTFALCADYILRSDDTLRIHYELDNFGDLTDLPMIASAARALAPLALSVGAHVSPRARPFEHTIVSLSPGEDLDDRQLCAVAKEALLALTRRDAKTPRPPMLTAVHRDTGAVHAHLLWVPVDLPTGQRLDIPDSVQTYRAVLKPIEERLGLSSPSTTGRWNEKRFYVPFKTWARMDDGRATDLRGALLKSSSWEQAMQQLARHGVKFMATSKEFAPGTSYYLAPFGTKARQAGASIKRDLFENAADAPSPRAISRSWGEFPVRLQAAFEQNAKPPGPQYTACPIGGERGELVHLRWQRYVRGKRSQRKQLEGMFERSISQATHTDPSLRTDDQIVMLDNPGDAQRSMLDTAEPMAFSHWVETAADTGDPEALWMSQLAARGCNQHPTLAAGAEAEGELVQNPSPDVEYLRLELLALRARAEPPKRKVDEKDTARPAPVLHRHVDEVEAIPAPTPERDRQALIQAHQQHR